MNKTAVGIAVTAAVLVIGVVLWRDRTAPVQEAMSPQTQHGAEVSEPTNFAEVGVLVFDASENVGQRTPILIYNNVRASLVFDALSFCALGQGSVPCMAMSVTFDVPFNQKEALIEGNLLSNGSVLVRKLRIDEGQPLYAIEPGQRFISWPHAMTLLRACEVEMAMQTHSLDIHLTLTDGSRLRTVEPMIDDIFKITQEINARCGGIGVGTE